MPVPLQSRDLCCFDGRSCRPASTCSHAPCVLGRTPGTTAALPAAGVGRAGRSVRQGGKTHLGLQGLYQAGKAPDSPSQGAGVQASGQHIPRALCHPAGHLGSPEQTPRHRLSLSRGNVIPTSAQVLFTREELRGKVTSFTKPTDAVAGEKKSSVISEI